MFSEQIDENEATFDSLRIAINISEGATLPAEEITAAAKARVPELDRLAKTAVLQALHRLLLGPHVASALDWLCQTTILHHLLPEVAATVNFTQDEGRAHKDVWKHTMQVVAQAPAELPIRWAALLHDIGKVPTRVTTDAGKVTFYGHPDVGARMFGQLARRLGFPAALAEEIRWLIINHQRISQYEESWTDSAVRRFGRELSPHLASLIKLSRADITSARPFKREAAWQRIDRLKQRIDALREIDARVPPLPSGIGNLLMEHFSLKPSREIGKLKELLEAAIAREELAPGQNADVYVAFLEENESSLLAKLKRTE